MYISLQLCFFLTKTCLDKNKTTFFLTIKFNTSTIHCQRTHHKTAFSNQNLVALTDGIDFLQCLGVRRPVLKQVGSCARARELFLWSLRFSLPLLSFFLSVRFWASWISVSSSKTDAIGFLTYSSTALHPACDESAKRMSFWRCLIRSKLLAIFSLASATLSLFS